MFALICPFVMLQELSWASACSFYMLYSEMVKCVAGKSDRSVKSETDKLLRLSVQIKNS